LPEFRFPEKAELHEEETRIMDKSLAIVPIAEDLTMRQPPSKKPGEQARGESEDRVERVLRRVIEKIKCRVLIGDYFDELAHRCQLKRLLMAFNSRPRPHLLPGL